MKVLLLIVAMLLLTACKQPHENKYFNNWKYSQKETIRLLKQEAELERQLAMCLRERNSDRSSNHETR